MRDKKKTLHKKIEDDIRQKVLSGELQPGEKLPGIREMADEVGVHYHTIRQAFNNLRNEGIVSCVRSQGTIVLDQSSQVVKVLVIMPFEGMSVATEVVRGIRSVFEEQSIDMDIFDTETNPEVELNALAQLDAKKYNGAIIMSEMTEELGYEILSFITSGMPMVMIDRYFSNFPTWNVASDNQRGGYLATSKLIERGCERVAMVCYGDYTTTQQRLDGYKNALAEHGRVALPELIKIIEFGEVDSPKATESLLEMDNPPYGIFYFNDFQAMKGMQAILKSGLSIPDDIAVIGFDNVDASSLCHPSLTTISQDGTELGRRAAELWIEQNSLQKSQRKSGKTALVDVKLVSRETA